MDPLLSISPLVTGGCTPIQWTTPDGNPPPDRAPPLIEYIDKARSSYATFLTVMCWITWGAIVVALLKYRKTKLLKASQPPMLALILLGNTASLIFISRRSIKLMSYLTCTLVVCIGMLYANIRVTLSTSNLATVKVCNARFWLGHLGFTIVPGLYH